MPTSFDTRLKKILEDATSFSGIKLSKRPKRAKIGKRTHSIVLTDEVMKKVYDVWAAKTSHTDNPQMEDAVVLRKMLEVVTEQNLDMLCIFWVRNEMVAIRKKSLKELQELTNGKANSEHTNDV